MAKKNLASLMNGIMGDTNPVASEVSSDERQEEKYASLVLLNDLENIDPIFLGASIMGLMKSYGTGS